MPNRLYNKQVSVKGYKEGGKVMKSAKEAVKNFRTKKASEAMKRKPTSKSGSSTKDIFKSYGKYDGKPIELKDGGMLKPVNKSKNPGLAKLPTQVRNKMGYMKDGGKVMRKAGLNVGETLKQFKDLMTGSKDSKMSKQKEGLKKQIAEAKAQTRDRAKVKK